MKRFSLLIAILVGLASVVLSDNRSTPSGSLFGDYKRTGNNVNKASSLHATNASTRGIPASSRYPGVKLHKDTALYLALGKRNGWYHGIGQPLTKEQAACQPRYYRLTERDSLGHYIHIESLTGAGPYNTEHNLGRYCLLDRYSGDVLWSHRLGSVCQWMLSADSRGRVATENAYDAQGDLVYSVCPVWINDSVYVNNYSDAFGEPVALHRDPSRGRYAQITVDSLGRDSKIIFIDDNLDLRRNSSGAYMLKYEYDSLGNIVMGMSCLMNGKPMNDEDGNCAYSASYDVRGQITSQRYYDSDMKPVRLNKSSANGEDVYGVKYAYDSLLRCVSKIYVNAEGARDCRSDGICEVRTEYGPGGLPRRQLYLGSDSCLLAPGQGPASVEYTYNPDGSYKTRTWRDSMGQLCNNASGYCYVDGSNRYEADGNGCMRPVYLVKRTASADTIRNFVSDLISVTHRDKKGRTVLKAYFDADMFSRTYDDVYCIVTRYVDGPKESIRVDSTFMTDGVTIDSVWTRHADNTRITRRYDSSNNLVTAFGQTIDPLTGDVNGQFGLDAIGHICRSHLDNALYYRLLTGYTYRGALAYCKGINEYGERSFVNTSDNSNDPIYHLRLYSDDEDFTYLDEDMAVIEDMSAFKASRDKAYCVEIISPEGEDCGLRSGDLIVRYGEFVYPEAVTDRWNPADSLQIAAYLARNTAKDVLVQRYNPERRCHEIKHMVLPPGSPSDLGLMVHQVILTKAEAKRFNDVVVDYIRSHGTGWLDASEAVTEGPRVCLIRPFTINTPESYTWQEGLRSDAIVLAISMKDDDGAQTYYDMTDSNLLNLYIALPRVDTTFYLTFDGKNIYAYNGTMGLNRFSISDCVLQNKAEYANLLELTRRLSDEIKVDGNIRVYTPSEPEPDVPDDRNQ